MDPTFTPEQVQQILARLRAGEAVPGWTYLKTAAGMRGGDTETWEPEGEQIHYDISPTRRQGFNLDGTASTPVFNPGEGYRRSVKYVEPLALAAFGTALGYGLLNGAGAAGAAGSSGTAAAGTGLGEAAALGINSGGLTPAAIEAGLGTAGYGANAGAAASGLFNPASIGAGAGASFGSGVGSALSGAGSALSGVGSALGGLKTIAPLVGGLLGTQKAPDQTETRTNRMDPRMEAYIYGSGQGDTNGLLGAAQDWFKTNRSGMNDTMRTALQQQVASYTDPQFRNNLNSARQTAMGLLSMPVAGNPFTRR